MKNTRTKLFTLISLFSLFVYLSFTVSAQNDTLTIGFSQVGRESAWRLAFTEATLAEAEARGINLLFLDADNSQENQISALRSFIEQGVDAIILAPVVETGWDQVLTEVKDAGIPLVVIDRNVTSDPALYITRVSSDFVHEGRLAATWLVQATSGNCKIIELEGTVGSSAARDRQIGFNQVIDLFPSMEIIFSQSGDFISEGGREVMEGIILSEDMTDVCAVWSHNDDMLIGAVEALKAANLNPGQDILTISVDAVPNIFQVMMDGNANATVELSPYMAAPAFDAIEAYLAGEQLPAWIPVQGNIYTQETAAEEYAKRSQ